MTLCDCNKSHSSMEIKTELKGIKKVNSLSWKSKFVGDLKRIRSKF